MQWHEGLPRVSTLLAWTSMRFKSFRNLQKLGRQPRRTICRFSFFVTDGLFFRISYFVFCSIIFGIVRLAGLYEIITAKTCRAGREYMETLYDALNDHLTGANEIPTDAYRFAAEVTAMAAWVGEGTYHDKRS